MSRGELTVCIVGAGPRGLSVLERICAHERKSPSGSALTVHVVDPYRAGPGKVWRTAQSRQLLMNTVASQVTVYTDDSVEMKGPVEDGPSLYEWSSALARSGSGATAGDAGAGAGSHASDASEASDGSDASDGELLAEARRLGPDSYPSRALYGRYLEETFDRVVEGAPGHVTIHVHRTLAVSLDDAAPDGAFPGAAPGAAARRAADRPQTLRLADGTVLTGLDAVVLALGHVPAKPTADEARTSEEARSGGLTHVLPANPADAELPDLAPGEPVLLRGLGLNFFDHMALLTVGRGGRFERAGDALRYVPSGHEPTLYAGSRRGIPYHARGENEKGAHGRYLPRLLTPALIAELADRAVDGERVHFGTDVWPLIAKEVESVYYGTLLTAAGRDGERAGLVDRYLAVSAGEEEQKLLEEYGIAAADHWNWEDISLPYGRRVFAHRGEFHDWLLDHLAADVREARAGNVSGPLKSALDVLRDLRNEIRLVVDHGRLEGNSYRDELQGWYTPLNAFLSIGPPASRIEELIALVEAGTVRLVGPGMRVRVAADGAGAPAFEATSDRVGGAPVHARVLVEARLPEPDVRRTGDPLLAHLLATGQISPYRIAGTCGSHYETGGVSVTERPYRVLGADGRAHPRRFAYGIPTEAVHWVTAAGIRPGVNSVTLGDSDAIALAVLELLPADGRDLDPGVDGLDLGGLDLDGADLDGAPRNGAGFSEVSL
ncbi:FAD/NAD(P)-binding protein [Streptomyces sp. ISL-66]|uniref:FAD/NAD(P)-binding protein n=1 Tax=Streptomyces sp. ISL-66 TaxID=2819186 RepID=UPI001BE78F66|nr:FAD/NAD(P)-binding protein [Streptomyces sp. ISL-66]MBT2469036.1 FAD/NAD(P)-binding protein [Streptomyces sp. ISL-66]